MRKLWWPEPLYEARPYGALTLGLIAGAASMAHAIAVDRWDLPYLAACVVGCGVMIYGIVIMQVRHNYRRRSRWRRGSRD